MYNKISISALKDRIAEATEESMKRYEDTHFDDRMVETLKFSAKAGATLGHLVSTVVKYNYLLNEYNELNEKYLAKMEEINKLYNELREERDKSLVRSV